MNEQAQYQAKLAQCAGTSALLPQQPTLKERLKSQKFHAEQNLANINCGVGCVGTPSWRGGVHYRIE